MIVSKILKFLPLCPMLVALISCGKKIDDGSNTESQLQEAQLPAEISLTTTVSSNGSEVHHHFDIHKDGDVSIPRFVNSEASVTNQFQLRLDMNVDAYEEEFHCTWVGSGKNYRFEKCMDPDGRDLELTEENVQLFRFPIDQGKKLIFKSTKRPPGSTVNARIDLPVNWK